MPKAQQKKPIAGLKILGLKDLTREIQRAPGFAEMLAALKNGRSATVDGAWGSASALAAAALALHAPATLVIVLAHVGDVDDFRDDVATFAGILPEVFPAWEKLPRELTACRRGIRPANAGAQEDWRAPARRGWWCARSRRRSSRFRSRKRSPRCRAPSPSATVLPIEVLTAWLLDRGMARAEVVEVPGEFSVRGGILDVFPADATDPVRIEFFGDEVESIRPFDVESQRSLDRWNSVTLTAAARLRRGRARAIFGHAADFFPEGTWVALLEPADLREEGRHYLEPARRPARALQRRGAASSD